MRNVPLVEYPIYIKEIRISGGEGCPIEITDGKKIVFKKQSMGGLEHLQFGMRRVEKLRIKVGNPNPKCTACSVRVVGFHEKGDKPAVPKVEPTRVIESPKISEKELEALKEELLGDA